MSVTILVQNIIFIAFPSNALEKVGFQISKSLVKTLQINLFDNQKKINYAFLKVFLRIGSSNKWLINFLK